MFTDYLPLLSAVFVLGIGIFSLIKNVRHKLNILFSLLCVSLSVWLFATFNLFTSKTDVDAIFWDRLVYVGVVFVPIFMYHFGLVFIGKKRKILLGMGYILSLIFLVLSRTDYFVSELFYYTWGVHTKARIGHHVFLIFFCVYILMAFFQIYTFYKEVKFPIKRNQAKYTLGALVALVCIGSWAYLPAYGISIFPFSYFSGLIFTVMVAYAMFRYRLMEIRLVISRSILYFLLIGFVTGTFVFTGFLSSQFFQNDQKRILVTNLILSIVVVIFLPILRNLINKNTDRIFFRKEINYQKTLQELTNKISLEIDLMKLVKFILEKLKNDLKLENTAMFIATDQQTFIKIDPHGRVSNREQVLKKNNELVKFLSQTENPIVLEELERQITDTTNNILHNKLQTILNDLEHLESALAVPVLVERKINAILLVGKKLSDEAFSQRDIDLFQIISPQIGSAIEKAKLYQESQQFNEKLKLEVQRATTKLREANKYLKDLDKAKSEFMSIASHQLRTPLTGIRGYLSMLDEGDYGPIEPKKAGIIKQVLDASTRLTRLVDIFLNVSRIENNRFILNLEPTQMEDIIDKEVFELSIPATNKGLQLIWKKPKKKLPLVNVDRDKIKDVVLNLIDNAIKYTEKGSISVIVEAKENNTIVHVKIKDTGVGIDPEDAKKLFNKFVRGSGIARIQPDGSGLGLFIGKKITEAHGGQIWVESDGLGQGSTFQFTLPAGKNAIAEAKTLQAG